MFVIEVLKVLLFGIVEGWTEWLPISSTGHLILLQSIIPLNQPEEFWNVFKVVIQLGAILAVVVVFWEDLWPFSRAKTPAQKQGIWVLWCKIAVACIPAGVLGLLFDDILDEYLSTPVVVALMLILYGIFFILIERMNRKRKFPIGKLSRLSLKTAFFIGMFQCLSLIPGTSRSGATILGAMLLGCSRPVAAEFSFVLGIPVMFGASLLKLVKHGLAFSGSQVFFLLFAMLVAFVVAAVSIRFLMKFVRKHNFAVFGYYRIVLGIIVLLYFMIIK